MTLCGILPGLFSPARDQCVLTVGLATGATALTWTSVLRPGERPPAPSPATSKWPRAGNALADHPDLQVTVRPMRRLNMTYGSAGTCAVSDKDELHSVRSSLTRRDIWCARASIAYGARRCLGC